MEYSVTAEERLYLRELAKKQLELSKLPVMLERQKHWYDNNELRSDKPVIIVEAGPFREELIPEMKCTSEIGRQLEAEMLFNIANHEMINDDKVMPDFIPVNRHISMKELDMDRVIHRAKDSHGKELGYSSEHLVKDLKNDFGLLKKSVYSYDDKGTMEHFDFVQNLLGDILETRITNNTLLWFMSFTARSVNIMGLERLMYSMMDYPEETMKLFDFILEDSFEYMDWQEENNLLALDNGNARAGSGSYGFTSELPTKQCKETGRITTRDIWGNMNSQESVGISPSMYEEFIFPIYKKAAERFGLVYYGCCEPVHEIWETCVSKLANLRKVSISPWCNEEYMGEALRGSNVIYSRKPSPNFLGVGSFDESAFKEHIKKTIKAARGCHAEIIFRDIYTLTDDNKKAGKAVKIVRNLVDDMWR
ncbi:MAG TPA: hypothetical protein P5315_03645 [Clostridia bacterium]|nr:hypothetical protein [Clostridia bacterium]